MHGLGVAIAHLAALVIADLAVAQHGDQAAIPVVTVNGPTVIAFWEVPSSDSVLVANPDLASALDDQQYYWAETRPRLATLGIAAVDQPGRRFRVRDQHGERVFVAAADSAAVGYLLVAPGRAYRVLYRVQFPDDLVAAARSFFQLPQRTPGLDHTGSRAPP